MRFYSSAYNMYRLTEEEINQLEQQVSEGNPEACYKLGRYLYCVRPEPDSVNRACALFIQANGEGVLDAKVALHTCWKNGDFGMVNRTKAKQFLLDALEGGSEYAAKCQVLNILYGTAEQEADPQKAINVLQSLIANSDNPYFYGLMGDAYEELGDHKEAALWYDKAWDNGVTDVAFLRAIAHAGGFDEENYINDYDTYLDYLEEGMEAENGWAIYLYFLNIYMNKLSEIEEGDKEEIERCKESLLSGLEFAASRGCGEAAVSLGDIYRNGDYHFEQDNNEAFSWYAKGAILQSKSGYENMYEMIAAGEIDYSQDFMDECAVCGTRLGSEFLMRKVVEGYKSGRLTHIAAEIEQYYLPEIEAEDEELPDDDGRYDAYA